MTDTEYAKDQGAAGMEPAAFAIWKMDNLPDVPTDVAWTAWQGAKFLQAKTVVA
jgi:hypothetical protein